MSIGKTIATATFVAGTLDILSAFAFGGMTGRTPAAILRGVASGPFGNRVTELGATGATIGLIVHFALMTAMVTAFVWAARNWPALLQRPWPVGVAYGLLIYATMYWLVLPLRWPAAFPQTSAWQVGNALFSHIACVGLPVSLVAARLLAPVPVTVAAN